MPERMRRALRNLLRLMADAALYYERKHTAELLRSYRCARDRYKNAGDGGISYSFNHGMAKNWLICHPLKRHRRTPI